MAEAGFNVKDDETYTTAQVAEQLGVAQSTLRRWERVGKIPKMARDSAGRRAYMEEDVEVITGFIVGTDSTNVKPRKKNDQSRLKCPAPSSRGDG